MARVGHSGMTADEVTENIEATVKTVATKIRMVSVAVQRVELIINGFVSLKNFKSLIFGCSVLSS